MNNFLEEAYLKTTYEIYKEQTTYSILIEQSNDYFQSFCKKNKISTWAIITAYNPYSKKCSKEENKNNNQNLKTILLDENYIILEASGVPENTNWESEKSYFVSNISLDSAKAIGIKFQQNAIVYGTNTSLAQLVWLV